MGKKSKTEMKRFQLHRNTDVSGISGIGIVAEGIEFSDGMCALTWLTEFHVVSIFENMKSIEHVHGHDGNTKVIFLD